VTDGTHTANLTLLGQYSTANFSLSSDGSGGTIVTDPPLVGSVGHATFDVVTDFNNTGTQPEAGNPFTYGTETSLNTGFTLFPNFQA